MTSIDFAGGIPGRDGWNRIDPDAEKPLYCLFNKDARSIGGEHAFGDAGQYAIGKTPRGTLFRIPPATWSGRDRRVQARCDLLTFPFF
jgi:hypothetical protein